MAERPHYRRFPAWFAEDTHEWTVVERMRYDLAEVNDAHAWNTSTTAVRAIADFLRIDADGVL